MRTYNRKDVFSLANAQEAKQYIGKSGYFGDSFEYLDNRLKTNESRTLIKIDIRNVCCFDAGNFYFGLFLPCDKVIEKHEYRPYKDADEFCEHHELGDFISFRHKENGYKYYEIFIGYVEVADGDDLANLGGVRYSLTELFNNYEFQNNAGEFVPFGVEE